jgi:hypothetical protein
MIDIRERYNKLFSKIAEIDPTIKAQEAAPKFYLYRMIAIDADGRMQGEEGFDPKTASYRTSAIEIDSGMWVEEASVESAAGWIKELNSRPVHIGKLPYISLDSLVKKDHTET